MDSMLYRKKWPLFIFLTPAFLFMIIFLFYPFIINIFNSFFNMTDLSSPVDLNEFSFDNYAQLISDDDFKISLINTLKMMVFAVVFQVGIALILALIVDSIKKAASFYRTVFFFPIVISSTAIALLFTLFYVPSGGIDQFLALFGIQNETLWLGEDIAFYMICIPVVWQYIGFYFVILLTGLSSISDEVYEAAEIDGATGLQKVHFVTLPLLHNVIVTCVILAITGSLKVFDLFWAMLPNGVNNTFLTGTYMFYVTNVKHTVSYGALIAIIIAVLGVLSAQICNMVLKPKDY